MNEAADPKSIKRQQRKRNLLEWLIAIIALVTFLGVAGLMYALFNHLLGGDVPTRGIVSSLCWVISAIVTFVEVKLLGRWLLK